MGFLKRLGANNEDELVLPPFQPFSAVSCCVYHACRLSIRNQASVIVIIWQCLGYIRSQLQYTYSGPQQLRVFFFRIIGLAEIPTRVIQEFNWDVFSCESSFFITLTHCHSKLPVWVIYPIFSSGCAEQEAGANHRMVGLCQLLPYPEE